MLTITTNADEVASDFGKLDAILVDSMVHDGIGPFVKEIELEARQHHRYQNKSGRLMRAIKSSVDRDSGSVYIDEGSAPYGKYVHDGTRHWASDPFITDAFDRKQADLERDADRAVGQAIQQAGLQ